MTEAVIADLLRYLFVCWLNTINGFLQGLREETPSANGKSTQIGLRQATADRENTAAGSRPAKRRKEQEVTLSLFGDPSSRT